MSVFDVAREQTDGSRFDSLGIGLPPLKIGRKVVFCELTELWAENHPWLKIDKDQFTQDVVNTIRSVTDREVVIKDKKAGKLSDLLQDAYCVVCHSSNAAIEALLHGVPVIALGESIASGIGPSLEFIEEVQDMRPEVFEQQRYNVMCNAANNQFTLKELSQAGTWDRILGWETWDGRTARSLR